VLVADVERGVPEVGQVRDANGLMPGTDRFRLSPDRWRHSSMVEERMTVMVRNDSPALAGVEPT